MVRRPLLAHLPALLAAAVAVGIADMGHIDTAAAVEGWARGNCYEPAREHRVVLASSPSWSAIEAHSHTAGGGLASGTSVRWGLGDAQKFGTWTHRIHLYIGRAGHLSEPNNRRRSTRPEGLLERRRRGRIQARGRERRTGAA
jgi:hypothetical protein